MKFEIKSRWSGAVLFSAETDSLKLAVELAVKSHADLAGAYLAGANLAGAYLAGADLAGAYLAGAYLAHADLAGANLAGANLAHADLAGANLAGANLAGAYLASANLAHADLAHADLAGANLAGANLAGANLAHAYLAGAYLAHADLAGATLERANGQKPTLIGNRPALVIGPLGSRCAYLTTFMTDAGVYVRAGCFWNTLDAFKAAVAETHGDNHHGREYRAAIALIEAHAELWTPAKEKAA
jgi:uncharacterized protein YjbI with pentapeptide repeats